MKQLDIVVPVKNEEKSIAELCRQINSALKSNNITYNIIFVVDKSKDNTLGEIKRLQNDYPIILHEKVGLPGKGYSLIEGCELATSQYIAFIDGDLQYPADKIPEMYKKAVQEDFGVVVANRKVYQSTFIRTLGSRLNVLVFGRLLLRLNCDIQSGLKLFNRDIFQHVDRTAITPWTFDIPLLFTAKELGYKIGQVNIQFVNRKYGASNVGFIKTAFAIAKSALIVMFSERKIYHLNDGESKIGSGIVYRRKKFVTHTNLPHHKSAIYTLVRKQKIALLLIFVLLTVGIVLSPMKAAVIFVAFLSSVYFFDVFFNLFVVLKSLHQPPEIDISDKELNDLRDEDLPIYTIMCPLYKEWEVLPQFVESVKEVDWPKDKLEVLLLLEENDSATIDVAQKMEMPDYVKTIIVPHSQPKTKPKACNYGLHRATGEYVVVYDAEDKPDPIQLKKAYLAFSKAKEDVFCIQAKLNYYNPHHNLLTRLFTAEYSLWFDVVLPGLQSINTTIPLGGTSNHFKTANLKALHGWDPFNVTEDCDLGVRLFKSGYKTAIINSTTLEEANSNTKNWIRQRSRWIKGYMQTYFVHMRDPLTFLKKNGWHALLFQLVIGMRIYFMLINPILWAATVSYFLLYKYVGPTIESLYPTPVFYMAAISLVFGNFIYLYNYMIGCAKKGHWSLVKFVFLVPFYWMMMSVGAVVAFYQLIFRPHHWEKTIHGLHLKKQQAAQQTAHVQTEAKVKKPKARIVINTPERLIWIKNLTKLGTSTAGVLVFAGIFTNFLNYLYNAFLSRSITLEDFGLISLIGSFLFLTSIPLSSLSRTVTHKTAFYLGKYNMPISKFWKYTRTRAVLIGLGAMVLWVIATPVLKTYFQAPSTLPFILFAPIWLIATVGAVDSGFLTGNLKFNVLASLIVLEAAIKITTTWVLVKTGNTNLVYAAIPLSTFFSFLIGYYFAKRIKGNPNIEDEKAMMKFPVKFFSTSVLLKFSTVAYLSFDVILAKHYLTPVEAGQYALIALIGKMIFFIGGLFGQFITPLISKEEGANRKSQKTFYKIFTASGLSSFGVYILVGLLGSIFAPFLLGSKISDVTRFLPLYGLGMLCFTFASNIIGYHQIRNKNVFPALSFAFSILQIIGISIYHESLKDVVIVMTSIGLINFALAVIFHFFEGQIEVICNNLMDLRDLFEKIPTRRTLDPHALNILILNWYDTKHTWGGGAEIYIHNLAKRLTENGHNITIFCGNDGHNPRYEEIDKIQIIRRGGLYTVAIWAFLYYTFKLKGKYDIVIDSAKGVPFFTPLYVRKPLIGLVCHVHQEMFRTGLKFPLREISMFLEGVLMPFVYRNTQMFTISESSKKAMEEIGLGIKHAIHIIYPGVDIIETKVKKTTHPSVVYLGRLRFYKRVDIAIKALKGLVNKYPNIQLYIAGSGESETYLKDLVAHLGLQENVKFLGKVTEEEKVELYAKSWVAIQPSIVEGWGMTNIEANLCGTPVVASNVEGLRDSVLDYKTGILVEPKNVESFANAIDMIFSSTKLRGDLSKNAVKWARNFSWENSAKSLLDFVNFKLNIPKGISAQEAVDQVLVASPKYE